MSAENASYVDRRLTRWQRIKLALLAAAIVLAWVITRPLGRSRPADDYARTRVIDAPTRQVEQILLERQEGHHG